MRDRRKAAVGVIVWGLVCASWAQSPVSPRNVKNSPPVLHRDDRALNDDERLSVMAAALDSKIPRFRERDCSHLVHAIYKKAGFPYSYASSDDLYDGIEGFQRVADPEPGDLVVWRGHAGIVIRPSRHVFFSFLRAGPTTDDYTSRYWKHRGQPRFYRYLKNDRCPGCTLARGRVE